jgi:hypothetical protein
VQLDRGRAPVSTTVAPISLKALTSGGRTCPEPCCSDPDWLQRFEHRGRSWLTNRYWLLDESILASDFDDDVTRPEPVPMHAADLRRLSPTLDLALDSPESLEPPARISPLYAHLLTDAGASVITIGMKGMHAVAHGPRRVGAIVPSDSPHAQPVPIPDTVAAVRSRLGTIAGLTSWQAWELAACIAAPTSGDQAGTS